MFKNMLKLTFRIFLKHKIHSRINLIGLTLGITSLIIISLYISDELSFDKFHKNFSQISRLVTVDHSQNDGNRYYSLVANPLGQMLKEEYPEVVEYASVIDRNGFGRFNLIYNEMSFQESEFLITGPEFFKVFDFEKPKNYSEEFLNNPGNIILTESKASKIFGKENPLGKIIESDRWGNLMVKGVMPDPPTNSHIQFSMLIAFKSLELNRYMRENVLYSLDRSSVRTYLLFDGEKSMRSFPTKLTAFEKRNKTEVFGTVENLMLQHMADIHFGSTNFEYSYNRGGKSITIIYIIGIIGIFIILIACINYSNLSNFLYLNRAKEFGVRKVVGESRKQMLSQVFMESIAMAFMALFISIIIVLLILPSFNSFYEKQLTLNFLQNNNIIWVAILLTMIFGFLSGSIPALYLSSINVNNLMKFKSNKSGSYDVIKKTLVILQFTISVILIFATIVINSQMNYIKEKDLGFDKNKKIIIDINSSDSRNNYQTLMTEFKNNPTVKTVSVSTNIPCDWKSISELQLRVPGEDKSKNREISFIGADKGFLEIYDIKLLSGKYFSGHDKSDSMSVVINEKTAKMLNLGDPIGREIILDTGRDHSRYKIIGVIKNFHFKSLHEPIGPFVLGYFNNPFESIDYYTVEISSINIQGTINHLKKVHETFDKTEFEYNFLDERIRDFYSQDEKEGVIINSASLLSILLACLGLFGLTAFTAQQKLKEIGIRKILGASMANIVYTFSKEFLVLILAAIIIGVPISYYFMLKWLQSFAYRINPGYYEITISFAFVFIISALTIAYQLIKVSNTNPIKIVRNE